MVKVLFLKQPVILPFLCHKSATTCQIESCKVSHSKLKPDLCSCVKAEITERMAQYRSSHTNGTQFLGAQS